LYIIVVLFVIICCLDKYSVFYGPNVNVFNYDLVFHIITMYSGEVSLFCSRTKFYAIEHAERSIDNLILTMKEISCAHGTVGHPLLRAVGPTLIDHK